MLVKVFPPAAIEDKTGLFPADQKKRTPDVESASSAAVLTPDIL
jgi:hypothetical protein